MKHQVFISYSSQDAPYANAICKTLEDAGIPCWIAPRDLTAGSRWGGSIVEAIQASKAILVVFSKHADESPQMSREVEIAVNARLQPIPIRIANSMPTGDMEYFLGVSHWFNAYPQPFRTYLPQIVDHTRRAMAGQSTAWKRFSRRLPALPGNAWTTYTVAALTVVLVVGAGLLMRHLMAPPNPMDALRSPMAGRWKAEIPDSSGKMHTCLLDASEIGHLVYSDSCPFPLAGAQAAVTVARDGTWAPQLFIPYKDTGTFLIQGGTLNGTAGAFRMEGRNHLITRTAVGADIDWKRSKDTTPIESAADQLIPPRIDWPLKDVPAIAARALEYARKKWQPDAVLISVKLELISTLGEMVANAQSTAGAVQVQFYFYSPGNQQGLMVSPNSPGGDIIPTGPTDPSEARALPADFLDLPNAIATLQARGMRAHQIKAADLENWQDGTSAGGVDLSGVEWMIDSAFGERYAVPAAVR